MKCFSGDSHVFLGVPTFFKYVCCKFSYSPYVFLNLIQISPKFPHIPLISPKCSSNSPYSPQNFTNNWRGALPASSRPALGDFTGAGAPGESMDPPFALVYVSNARSNDASVCMSEDSTERQSQAGGRDVTQGVRKCPRMHKGSWACKCARQWAKRRASVKQELHGRRASLLDFLGPGRSLEEAAHPR